MNPLHMIARAATKAHLQGAQRARASSAGEHPKAIVHRDSPTRTQAQGQRHAGGFRGKGVAITSRADARRLHLRKAQRQQLLRA